MYTYIVSFIIFSSIVLMIYRNRIREKMFNAALIVAGGIFLSVVLVNYFLQDRVTYVEREVKTFTLQNDNSFVINDSVTIEISPLRFDNVTAGWPSPGDNIGKHYILRGGRIYFGEFSLHFYEEGDSINTEPIAIKYRSKPISDSKWVYTLGLPEKNTRFEFWLPHNDINKHIAEVIELKRKEDEGK